MVVLGVGIEEWRGDGGERDDVVVVGGDKIRSRVNALTPFPGPLCSALVSRRWVVNFYIIDLFW